MSQAPPPLVDNDDDLFDKDNENEDLFSSALDDMNIVKSGVINPLPDLPTLQLSVEKSVASSPIDESTHEDVSVHSPTPTQKYQPPLLIKDMNIVKSGVINPLPDLPTLQLSVDPNSTGVDQYIDIRVTDATRLGDGMAAYIVFRVETKTNIPLFRKTFFSVQRRFSDFLGLHEKLVEKYLRLGRIIPPAPEKSVIGMTKIKMSGPNDVSPPTEFLERRRASLERYLQRTAAHPVLNVDPDFREFLSSETELPKASNTSTLSGAGMLRFFNKIGETVNKITYRMEGYDSWFEEKSQEIENLENGLRKLHSNMECLVLARKELAVYTGALAKTIAMLSNCEEHTLLSRCLAHLTELEEKTETLHHEQANSDFSTVCEMMKDYIALIGAIKCVFHERVKVYQNCQHSQLMLNKKKEYKAKMEFANRTDKVSIAAQEIVEWEAKVERCEEEFNNISKMIKKEMERFEAVRVEEFKAVFIRYMEDQLKHQIQLVKYWEAFLPEAKAIA
ncbi:sorting nexin-2 isoform X3 [Halyomorpha halys]|uniref:sorting nexin-2 isoform X3 n=1 Tax=Halyomorpha halys TaxID=286706 RepID=UPI0006D52334|nr:sorting nexin-2 isoform X3 [Halyomorpha halys]